MSGIAKARFVRIRTKKGRLPVRLIKNKDVETALLILKNLPNRSAKLLYKTVKSAYSNMLNAEPALKETDVFVKSVSIDKGPIMKRVKPRARGRADIIKKRFGHIQVIVDKN